MDRIRFHKMIEFAKILDDMEGNMVRVKFRTGETLLAPFSVCGNDVSVPSKKWLSTNKDNFLALVAFEKNLHENPVIIGFYPVKGASSKEYNTHERLLSLVTKLVEKLSAAKVNTQIGPQKFMPDTQFALEDIKKELQLIKEDILEVKI